MRIAPLLLGFALILGACGTKVPTSSGTVPSTTAAKTSNTSRPAVILANGSRVEIEVVSDPETRAQGLMFRSSLSPDRGMLFVFPTQDLYPFWMKNTLIPLDMIWIDRNRKVVFVASDVPPCTADPCASYPPSGAALYVLELAAGQAAARSIRPGDVVRIEGTENIVAR